MNAGRHRTELKVQIQAYIDIQTWEKLKEWLEEYECSISKAALAAIKVGLKHQNEMFNEMNRKEGKDHDL